MKPKAKVCFVAAISVVVLICFVGLLFSRDAVPVEKYNQVAVGMTQSQVRDIMGLPDRIRHDSRDTTAFFYGGFLRLRWDSMEVYFDADGHVTGKFDDD